MIFKGLFQPKRFCDSIVVFFYSCSLYDLLLIRGVLLLISKSDDELSVGSKW